jgi:glycerophosphoryl diester phosphodiesterase
MNSETRSRSDRSVLRVGLDGLGKVARTWPQLAAADLATRVAATLVLTPAVAFVVRRALERAGGGAVTDQDILWFLLSPLGIATLLVVGAGSLVAGLFGHTAIMTVAAGVEEDRAVSWLGGMRHAANRFFSILELAVRGLLRLLVDAAPWLAAGGLVYVLLLTGHDINYYLAERPPRFWVAAVLIGAALAGLAWFVGRRLLSWSIALPRMLFGGASPAGALRASAEVVHGRRWRVLALLALWAGGTVLASVLVAGAAGAIGRWLVPEGSTNLTAMAGGIAVATVIGSVANLVVSIVSSIALAVLLFELDRAWAEPWILPAEAAAEPGTLGRRASLAVPGWAWVLLAVAVPLGSVAVGVVLLRSIDVEDEVQITAHRGASGRAPENTLAAVRAAIADSADWVEIDVQETSDGVVVVHHDADFMRVARDARKTWETPYEAVAQIPNGAWYGPEFEAERVATLEETLRVSKDRIRVNIELKVYGHGQRLEERVIELVESLGMEDQVALMSLDRPTVQTLNELRPGWKVGLLAAVSIGDLSKLDADFLAVNAKNATSAFVKRVHASGKELQVWTVDHPAQMSAMISAGADVLITNEPALARDVLRQRAEMSPVERLLLSAGARFGVVEGANESSEVDDA